MRTNTNRASSRDSILQTSILVISKRGYKEFSYGQLATELSISKGVVNYHFASKDLLIEALMSSIAARYGEYVTAAIAQADGPAATIRAFIRSALSYAARNLAEITALSEIVYHVRSADGTPRYSSIVRHHALNKIASIISQGQDSGDFKPIDPKVAAIFIKGTLDEYVRSWQDTGEATLKDSEDAIRNAIAVIDQLIIKQGDKK